MATRVDLHTPKMLIIQFHTTKIIIIQIHTSSKWRKCLSYNFHTFSINNRNKINQFSDFLRTVEQTGDKKTDLKNFLKKMLSEQFPYVEMVWLAFFDGIFENLLQNFFFFFSNANWIWYANKHFPKKKLFLHAKFNFSVRIKSWIR